MRRRTLHESLGGLAGAALLLLGAGLLSHWPLALLLRGAFAEGAIRFSRKLERHQPAGVVSRLDLPFDPAGPGARLDLHLPSGHPDPRAPEARPHPLLVWVHGGGFVAGHRRDVANYGRVLAGHGLAVAVPGYPRAPRATWPAPLHAVDAALRALLRDADAVGIDPRRILLAGDSAGAHIAAEYALAVTDPAHAAALGLSPALGRPGLRGVLLFAGVFDPGLVGRDNLFDRVLGAALSAYAGGPASRVTALPARVGAGFPPAFVTVGDGDPLAPHSAAIARALAAAGAEVETLFFPPGQGPALPHVYQFDLDTEAGRLALDRALAFIRRVTRPPRCGAEELAGEGRRPAGGTLSPPDA